MREGLDYRKAEVAGRGWELDFVGARVGRDSRICADQAQHEFPTSFWTLETGDWKAENQRLSRACDAAMQLGRTFSAGFA